MPAGEVDTSAIATAILHSGMQLARGSTSTPPFFSCQIRVFTIPNFFYYLRREEPVRAESGCCAAGGDGPPPDLRRRGPARAAERRLGHQGADVSVPRRAQDERSVPAAHSPPGQLSTNVFANDEDDGRGGAGWGGATAKDDDSIPLDVILIPGK